MADFTFPQLTPVETKAPLTAKSTVQHSGKGPVVPVKAPVAASNLEHRNKGDPFLTRFIYGLIARFSNVPLEKGFSQVDWMRLSRSSPAPALRKDITLAEVKQHRTKDDAWMVLKNRVYNISPYLKFHPGGPDILLKAAGKDGTSLFMKYHPWVNIDALMEKCLVGWLAEPDTPPAGAPASKGSTQPAAAPAAGQEELQERAQQGVRDGSGIAAAEQQPTAAGLLQAGRDFEQQVASQAAEQQQQRQ